MNPNTRPLPPGGKPLAQPARFDAFGQRRLGQALLNHPPTGQAAPPPAPPPPANTAAPPPADPSGSMRLPNFGARRMDVFNEINPGFTPGGGQGQAMRAALPEHVQDFGAGRLAQYRSTHNRPELGGTVATETAQTQSPPQQLGGRFADMGKARLAQALLNRPELAQRQQGNGGVVANETPQQPAPVQDAAPAQQPVTPEMMSLMLTGRPDPNFDPQQYYNQGIMPQHDGSGMIDPRFMVPPGTGPTKTSWLDQINAMMRGATQ